MGIDHHTGDHLGDLGRELADWLRARTGWPEGVVDGACRLAIDAAGGGPVEADADLEGDDVHLHLCGCAEVDLEISVSAHDGDVVLHTC
jgi:hypothetical protein